MSERNPEALQLLMIGALSGMILSATIYLVSEAKSDGITFDKCSDTESVPITPSQDSINYQPETDPIVLSEFASSDVSEYLSTDLQDASLEQLICLNEVSLSFNLSDDGQGLSELYFDSADN